MIRQGSVLVVLVGLAGCTAGAVRLTPTATSVQVGSNSPESGYTQIGPISAKNGGGCGLYGSQGTYAGAINSLRNQAAEMGADYVQIISQEGEHMIGLCLDRAYTIDGYAYKRVAAPPSGLSDSYRKRVQSIQSRVLSGSLPTIQSNIVSEAPPSLQKLSYGEATILEAEQTWWFGANEKFFMHIKNGTSFNVSTLTLAFTEGTCTKPQAPSQDLTITLASPVPPNGEFVTNLPAAAISPAWKSIRCETIIDAWAVRNGANG